MFPKCYDVPCQLEDKFIWCLWYLQTFDSGGGIRFGIIVKQSIRIYEKCIFGRRVFRFNHGGCAVDCEAKRTVLVFGLFMGRDSMLSVNGCMRPDELQIQQG